MMGVASRGWMMALAVAPQMVASLKGPGLMSVLAQDVSPEQQGVLQGSVMSLRVISKVCLDYRLVHRSCITYPP